MANQGSEDNNNTNGPHNDFQLAGTVRQLYKTYRMAGHLHRGFPIYRNPINANEGIILSASAVTIWAEAIVGYFLFIR